MSIGSKRETADSGFPGFPGFPRFPEFPRVSQDSQDSHGIPRILKRFSKKFPKNFQNSHHTCGFLIASENNRKLQNNKSEDPTFFNLMFLLTQLFYFLILRLTKRCRIVGHCFQTVFFLFGT